MVFFLVAISQGGYMEIRAGPETVFFFCTNLGKERKRD